MQRPAAPGATAAVTADLMARKAETREIGTGPLPEPIATLIAQEFAAARELFETGPVRASPEARAKADAFFREVVRG
ncbi:MAG TPA: hypothetical protein VGR19_11140 [Allosphingosinicella sp.]|nr:hypothetical protein [Allosphingosinicella sp.]